MTPVKEFYEKQAEHIIRHLEKRNMEGYYCPDCQSAVQKAMSLIPKGSTVSWGGSMTLSQCGRMDALSDSDLTLFSREKARTPEEKKAAYRQAFSADYYLMGCNAITLDGQLVNIDGNGNRVAALAYGPDYILMLVGMNKVVSSPEEAVSRVHTAAAPPNAMRLSTKTPCQATGVCQNCLSPDCICCQTVITRFSRTPGRIKVILIGEVLGY